MDDEGYWEDEAPKDVIVTTIPRAELDRRIAAQEAARMKIQKDWDEQEAAAAKKDREDRLKAEAEEQDVEDRKKTVEVFKAIMAAPVVGPRKQLAVRNLPGTLTDFEKKAADVWIRDIHMNHHQVAAILTQELGENITHDRVRYCTLKKSFNEHMTTMIKLSNEAKAHRVLGGYLDAGLDENLRKKRKIQHPVIMDAVKLGIGSGSLGRPKKRLAFTMEEY